MAQLDESKKYGRVRGLSGVMYEQDGQLFNAQKEPVNAKGETLTKGSKTSAPEKPAESATEAPDTGGEPVANQAPAKKPAAKKPARSRSKAKTPANQPAVPAGVKPMRDQAQDDA